MYTPYTLIYTYIDTILYVHQERERERERVRAREREREREKEIYRFVHGKVDMVLGRSHPGA